MDRRVILGLGLVTFGILFLLGNILPGFSAWWFIGMYWPLILIVFGIFNLSRGCKERRLSWGILLILLGVVFQLNEFRVLNIEFWPLLTAVVLIWVGVTMIFRKKVHKQIKCDSESDFDSDPNFNFDSGNTRYHQQADDLIIAQASFSSVDVVNLSQDFRGGSTSATFGAARVDLRGAVLSNNPGILELNAAFGEIQILLPMEWNVLIKPQSTLGSVENISRNKFDLNEPYLTIQANAMFGSVKVMN
jgi:predicted membrane protein